MDMGARVMDAHRETDRELGILCEHYGQLEARKRGASREHERLGQLDEEQATRDRERELAVRYAGKFKGENPSRTVVGNSIKSTIKKGYLARTGRKLVDDVMKALEQN